MQYPQPVPVITGTVIGYGWGPVNPNRARVLMIRSARRGNRLVFPGGIFDANEDSDPFATAKRELGEETGYEFVSSQHGLPWLAAVKFDRQSDRREFAGMKTVHCCDFVVAGPVRQVGDVEDQDEVAAIEWVDLRDEEVLQSVLTEENVALGHLAIAAAWLRILSKYESDHCRPEQFGPVIIGDYPPEGIRLKKWW